MKDFKAIKGEIWKQCNFNEDYEVSNLGRVRKIKVGKFVEINQSIDKSGHYKITCKQNGKIKGYYTHILIAEAFGLPKPDNANNEKLEVHHIDGVKTNNNVDNIVILTAS